MKLILEDMELAEPEVIIRGDLSSPEVAGLIARIKAPAAVRRLEVASDGDSCFIDCRDIVFIASAADKVEIYTESESFTSRMRLYEISSRLDRSSFVQISKSTIVNIDFVKSIQAEFSGNYIAFLKNRPEKLIISRRYFKEFKERI